MSKEREIRQAAVAILTAGYEAEREGAPADTSAMESALAEFRFTPPTCQAPLELLPFIEDIARQMLAEVTATHTWLMVLFISLATEVGDMHPAGDRLVREFLQRAGLAAAADDGTGAGSG